MAVATIAVKGANGEGQTGFFSNFLSSYIEETSASMGRSLLATSLQVADNNSLIGQGATIVGGGSGGGEINGKSIELGMIQNNSVAAYSLASEDYIDSVGFRRSGIIEYEVQEGDLLTFIASDFGVSISSIRWANNLSGDIIRPEQKLKIPPVSGVIHRVKKGDTPSSIAKQYGAEAAEIFAFNSLPKSGHLDVGDEIIVPDGAPKSSGKAPSSGSSSSPVTGPFSHLPDLGDYFKIPAVGFNWGKIHGRNGVDIANSCGTPIVAAASGTVAVADDQGWNGGFGKFIKIIHDNKTETLYAHASKLLVQAGQSVSQGSTVATMGTTGKSTGCHVHFEVHGAKNSLAKY